MLRLFYWCLLRLHPARFRRRFGEEMLSIFDQVERGPAAAKLVADGFISLARQWTMRSRYWGEESIVNVPAAVDSVPLFYTFDTFKPRTAALIDGGILALFVFCALCLALRYNWTHPVHIPFSGIQFDTSAYMDRPASSRILFPSAAPVHPQRLSISPPSLAESLPAVPSPLGGPAFSRLQALAPLSGGRRQGRFIAGVRYSALAANAGRRQVGASFFPNKVWSEDLRSYTGAYTTNPPNKLTILIAAEDGHLVIQISGEPKYTLVPAHGRRFTFSDPNSNWIEFVRRENGTAYELSIYRNGSHLTAYPKRNR